MGIELINYIKKQEKDYLSILKQMVEMESPTYNKELVDKLSYFIEEFLKEENMSVTRIHNDSLGDHLIGEWGDGEEQLLFIGHIDTVWEEGTINRIPFSIKEGVVRGPGVYDMKGGILQALYSLKVINQLDLKSQYKIVFLINSDEEIGSPSSRNLIEELGKKSKFVLVAEGANLPSGIIKTERKGCGFFDVEIKGVASHAGADPENGASSIHEFAKQVLYLESLADHSKGTTINVGVVEGGTRVNVVAENVKASVDLRVKTLQEAERVVPLIKGLKPYDERVQLIVKGDLNRPPMEKNEKNINLFNRISEIASELDIELEGTATGGMSDANLTSALGIPTIDGLGVVGSGAHSEDEQSMLEFIPERIALLVKLFTEL